MVSLQLNQRLASATREPACAGGWGAWLQSEAGLFEALRCAVIAVMAGAARAWG